MQSILDQINDAFGVLVSYLYPVLFFDIAEIPLIVLVLLIGALTFTIYFKFINIRGFRHAIEIIKGKYDNPNDTGQISHFQALTSALSATIGLGNIAGVAIAVTLGGPGAVFWMVFIAFFSMSAKFVSATLGQLYRKVNADGSVSGGPMYYLDYALRKEGDPYHACSIFAKILAILYAIFIIGGAFGGGNMFQANQSYELFGKLTGIPDYLYGILLAILVGIVIIGGIKRIGETTEKIVPAMVVIYVLASLFIIISNITMLPTVISTIFSEAFSPSAAYGGFIGALVTGIKRGVFSNAGGVGSASIAHSAAKTDEPVREGIVAMVGPFIDTIVVCFMTASVILITADINPLYQVGGGINGAELTSAAFGSVISWFPYILSIVVFLFSYSTMISWYYYGDKGWKYLFGASSIKAYQCIYLGCIVLGSVASLGSVIDFSDMMILSCGFPNIIGAMFLLPIVKETLTDYWSRYRNNQFQVYR